MDSREWVGRGRMLGAVVLLMVAGPAIAKTDRAADRRVIRAGESAWGGSFASGDAAIADRLLAPDFSGTSSSGRIYDKATILADIRTGPRIASNVTKVSSIRFFGDIAVVQGRDAVVGAPPAQARHEQAWTDVWQRRGRKWLIVSSHDTRLAATAAQPTP